MWSGSSIGGPGQLSDNVTVIGKEPRGGFGGEKKVTKIFSKVNFNLQLNETNPRLLRLFVWEI